MRVRAGCRGGPEPAPCGPPSLGHTVSLPEGTRAVVRTRHGLVLILQADEIWGRVLPTRCPSHLAASAGVREKLKA